MLVCNVSQGARRAAIAANIAEAAVALDSATQGHVVFATLVDDPANVGDRVDAYLGEIMIEAAAAASTVNAGLVYAAAVVEASIAVDVTTATVPGVLAGSVSEAASAADILDAAVTNAVMRTAAIAGLSPMRVNSGVPPIKSSQLSSGTMLGA